MPTEFSVEKRTDRKWSLSTDCIEGLVNELFENVKKTGQRNLGGIISGTALYKGSEVEWCCGSRFITTKTVQAGKEVTLESYGHAWLRVSSEKDIDLFDAELRAKRYFDRPRKVLIFCQKDIYNNYAACITLGKSTASVGFAPVTDSLFSEDRYDLMVIESCMFSNDMEKLYLLLTNLKKRDQNMKICVVGHIRFGDESEIHRKNCLSAGADKYIPHESIVTTELTKAALEYL